MRHARRTNALSKTSRRAHGRDERKKNEVTSVGRTCGIAVRAIKQDTVMARGVNWRFISGALNRESACTPTLHLRSQTPFVPPILSFFFPPLPLPFFFSVYFYLPVLSSRDPPLLRPFLFAHVQKLSYAPASEISWPAQLYALAESTCDGLAWAVCRRN